MLKKNAIKLIALNLALVMLLSFAMVMAPAVAAANQFFVSVWVNNPALGEASANSTWASPGQNVRLVATPGNLAVFDYWIVQFGSDQPFELQGRIADFAMPYENVYVVAMFSQSSQATYTTSVSVNNSSWGQASAVPNPAAPGQTVSLVATPGNLYVFDRWEVISGSAPNFDRFERAVQFAMPANNLSVRAVFAQSSQTTFSTTVTVNNSSWGQASAVPNPAAPGQTVYLVATPGNLYAFDRWEVISGSAPNFDIYNRSVQFAMPSNNLSIRAVFSATSQTRFSTSVSVNNSLWGRASATPNQATAGQEVRLVATPGNLYVFERWEVLSGSAPYFDVYDRIARFNMPSNNLSIRAVFSSGLAILATASPFNGGTVTGGGTHTSGGSATLRAFPNSGWTFDGWYENGVRIGTNTTLSFTVTQNRTIEARFRQSQYISPNIPNLDTAAPWARDGITSAVEKGFVPWELQDHYRNVITRGEFCRLAVRYMEYATGWTIDDIMASRGVSRQQGAFSDTNDPDILAAFALGIITCTRAPSPGNPGRFTPNGNFTREQAATMLTNVCRALGYNVDNAPDSGFRDIGLAASWAVAGINFVRSQEFMVGDRGNFNPRGTYTRQESILMFDNMR